MSFRVFDRGNGKWLHWNKVHGGAVWKKRFDGSHFFDSIDVEP